MKENIISALIIGGLVGGAILLNGQLTKQNYPHKEMHMQMMKPGMHSEIMLMDKLEMDDAVSWKSKDGKNIRIMKKQNMEGKSLKEMDKKVLMFKTDGNLDLSNLDIDVTELEEIVIQSIDQGLENLPQALEGIVGSLDDVDIDVTENSEGEEKEIKVRVKIKKSADEE